MWNEFSAVETPVDIPTDEFLRRLQYTLELHRQNTWKMFKHVCGNLCFLVIVDDVVFWVNQTVEQFFVEELCGKL